MDNKLKEVVKKYYETKCYAIIDKHFKENYPPEILTELHEQLNKGYINIVNKTSWSQDFQWGGTNRIYLMDLFLNPPNHEVVLKYFNRSGEAQIGDAIAMLHLCDNLFLDEVHLMDVPAFAYAAAFQQIQYESVFLKNESNWHKDVFAQRMQFLIKLLFIMLVNNKNFVNTKFIIHIPHFYETSFQVHNFVHEIRRRNKMTTYREKARMELPNCRYELYLTLVNAIIHTSQYAMKLKGDIVRPDIWYYTPLVTPLERFILNEESISAYHISRLQFLYTSGMERAIDVIMKKGDKQRLAELLKESSSEKTIMYPEEMKDLHNSPFNNLWAVDKMSNKFEGYPSKIIEQRLVLENCMNTERMCIAMVVIDIDKLRFDNATKDFTWHLANAQLLYSNAQEINALRASFQSSAGDLPLQVIVKSSDAEFNDLLKIKLDEITATLKSTHLHNYTYKIEGD